MMSFNVTEVVKNLLIINILVFFGTLLMGDGTGATSFAELGRYKLALFYPQSVFFQPFQIVTSFFMHAGIAHLFMNMLGLYFLGPPLEAYWGGKRFLFYYIFTALGATALYLLVQYLEINFLNTITLREANSIPVLGASGAIFGLLAAFGMIFPRQKVGLLFLPIMIEARYFVIIYGVIELFFGVSGINTGIAHFAHLGGALFGALLILYWRYNKKRW